MDRHIFYKIKNVLNWIDMFSIQKFFFIGSTFSWSDLKIQKLDRVCSYPILFFLNWINFSSVELKHLCTTDTFVLIWHICGELTHLCWTVLYASSTQMHQFNTNVSVTHKSVSSTPKKPKFNAYASVLYKCLFESGTAAFMWS